MGLDLFPTEMERGFILVALGLLYDLATGDISTSQERDLRAIIHFYGTELRQSARVSSWGLAERAEIWNHTVIGYAGIGVAGLVLQRHHEEAGEWINVAVRKVCGYLRRGLTHAGPTAKGPSTRVCR